MSAKIPSTVIEFQDSFLKAANALKKPDEKVTTKIQEDNQGQLTTALLKGAETWASSFGIRSSHNFYVEGSSIENRRIFNIFYKTFIDEKAEDVYLNYFGQTEKKSLELLRVSRDEEKSIRGLALRAATDKFGVQRGSLPYKKAARALYYMSHEQFCELFAEASKNKGYQTPITLQKVTEKPNWVEQKVKNLEEENKIRYERGQVFAIEQGKGSTEWKLYVESNENADFSKARKYIVVHGDLEGLEKLEAYQDCVTPFTLERVVLLNNPSSIKDLPESSGSKELIVDLGEIPLKKLEDL